MGSSPTFEGGVPRPLPLKIIAKAVERGGGYQTDSPADSLYSYATCAAVLIFVQSCSLKYQAIDYQLIVTAGGCSLQQSVSDFCKTLQSVCSKSKNQCPKKAI